MLEIKIWHKENLVTVSLIVNSKNKNFAQIQRMLTSEYPYLITEKNTTYDKIPKNANLSRTISVNKIEFYRGEEITEIVVSYGCNLASLANQENDINEITHNIKFKPIEKRKSFLHEKLTADLETNAGSYRLTKQTEEEIRLELEIKNLTDNVENWKQIEKSKQAKKNCKKQENILISIKQKEEVLANTVKKLKDISEKKSQLLTSRGRNADKIIQLITSETQQAYYFDEISFLHEIAALVKETTVECSANEYACQIRNCLSRSALRGLQNKVIEDSSQKNFFGSVTSYSIDELSAWLIKLQTYTQLANKIDENKKEKDNQALIAKQNIFVKLPIKDPELELISLKTALLNLIANFKSNYNHFPDSITPLLWFENQLNTSELNDVISIFYELGNVGEYAQSSTSEAETNLLKDMVCLTYKFFSKEDQSFHYKYLKQTTKNNPAKDVTLSRGKWKDPDGSVEEYFVNKFLLITLNTHEKNKKNKTEMRFI